MCGHVTLHLIPDQLWRYDVQPDPRDTADCSSPTDTHDYSEEHLHMILHLNPWPVNSSFKPRACLHSHDTLITPKHQLTELTCNASKLCSLDFMNESGYSWQWRQNLIIGTSDAILLCEMWCSINKQYFYWTTSVHFYYFMTQESQDVFKSAVKTLSCHVTHMHSSIRHRMQVNVYMWEKSRCVSLYDEAVYDSTLMKENRWRRLHHWE